MFSYKFSQKFTPGLSRGFTRQNFLPAQIWNKFSAGEKKNLGGFTLIELLIVIAIIGILSSVVLVNLSSTKNKGNRSSALATMASVIPELATCADDAGFGLTTVAPTTAVWVCCNVASTTVAACSGAGNNEPGHTITWPSLGNTGWAYAAPTGTLAAGTYQYTLTKSGETTITCNVSTYSCN